MDELQNLKEKENKLDLKSMPTSDQKILDKFEINS